MRKIFYWIECCRKWFYASTQAKGFWICTNSNSANAFQNGIGMLQWTQRNFIYFKISHNIHFQNISPISISTCTNRRLSCVNTNQSYPAHWYVATIDFIYPEPGATSHSSHHSDVELVRIEYTFIALLRIHKWSLAYQFQSLPPPLLLLFEHDLATFTTHPHVNSATFTVHIAKSQILFFSHRAFDIPGGVVSGCVPICAAGSSFVNSKSYLCSNKSTGFETSRLTRLTHHPPPLPCPARNLA